MTFSLILVLLLLFWAVSALRAQFAAPQPSALTASNEAPEVPQEPPAAACLPPAEGIPEASAPPKGLSGRLGLWVAEIDPSTQQPLRVVAHQPNEVFPLASTYKQAVLWALMREVDAGNVSLETTLDVTEQNRSLGPYPYDDSTIENLAKRMIGVSDNTATDTLHRLVGLQKVQAVADDLGLCNTRLILPTKDWWAMEIGLSPTAALHPDWWQRNDRLQLAEAIDAEAQKITVGELGPKSDEYFEKTHKPEDEMHTHNLSTPHEFATLVAHLYTNSGLTPESDALKMQIGALGYGKRALRFSDSLEGEKVTAETFAGKGGNGWRLLTYTGYVHTSDDRHYVYAFMQHGAHETFTLPNSSMAFQWINDNIGLLRR